MTDETSRTAVRLLINDPVRDGRALVFTNDEVDAYLALENGSVKRAAAQAIDTIADDQVLVLKVMTDRGLTLDGAKAADSLRKRAAALRAQADREQADADAAEDDGYFDIVDIV